MKLFQSATLRLTGWYMLILTVLCLLFSTIVYNIGSTELNRQPPKGGFGRYEATLGDDLQDYLAKERETRAEEASHRLLINLFMFNVLALSTGGLCAYLLARHTLRPIAQAMESQARFSSDAAHELRTPLSVMQSEIEVALRSKTTSKHDLQATLTSNLEEVARLQALTSRLLLLSQTEKITVEPTRVDEAVTGAVNNVVSSAQKKHIAIENSVDKTRALADQAVLADIVTILLDNAIKYSPKKSTIRISNTTKGKTVRLHISDEGRGIHKHDLAHIFDRFYRADTSRTKDETEGHGLGLSIAKRLVTAMNGTIQVQSTPGKGSTFTLRLPLDK